MPDIKRDRNQKSRGLFTAERMALGMVIGTAVGAVVFSVTNDESWLAAGIAIGAGVGVAISGGC